MNPFARTIACFLVACATVSLAASSTVLKTPTPRGKLVDLGGHRLNVYCTGNGPFTVVVETGLGDFSFDWLLVQEKVEKFSRICTYDRGGYAWSDPGPKPRTFAQLNLELHDALNKLGEHAPLILVGHSFGGGVVRNYALTYPSQVAGMVLVDIVQEDQQIPMGPKKVGRVRDSAKGTPIPEPRENLLPSDRPTPPERPGVTQEVEPPSSLLPPKERRLHIWAEQLSALIDAETSQKEWSAEYMERWYSTPQDGSLGAVPLIVLTRAHGGYGDDLDVPAKDLEADRLRLQSNLERLSKNGKQIIVDSGHNMNLEAPGTVADAIRQVNILCLEAERQDRSR